MTKIDFGLCYNFRNPEPFRVDSARFYDEMFEQIQYAEELGFDTIWLPETIFHQPTATILHLSPWRLPLQLGQSESK